MKNNRVNSIATTLSLFVSLFLLSWCFLLLPSCTTYNNYSEVLDENMARITPNPGKAVIIPEIPLFAIEFPEAINVVEKSRIPASVANNNTNTNKNKNKNVDIASEIANKQRSSFSSFSNKKIYFLALLDQYEQLNFFLQEGNSPEDGPVSPPIEFCPQFHTIYLNYYNTYSMQKLTVVSRNKKHQRLLPNGGGDSRNLIERYQLENKLQREDLLPLFPEMYLPAGQENTRPNVYDILGVKGGKSSINDKEVAIKVMVDAFKLHLQRNYRELEELCEKGNSSNYYVFENLINHMKNNRDYRRSAQAMQALLKISLVNNVALISSLEAEFFPINTANGVTKYREVPQISEGTVKMRNEIVQVVFERLEADWSQIYFSELKRRKALAIIASKQ